MIIKGKGYQSLDKGLNIFDMSFQLFMKEPLRFKEKYLRKKEKKKKKRIGISHICYILNGIIFLLFPFFTKLHQPYCLCQFFNVMYW